MVTCILSGVIGVGLALAASGCVVKDTAIDDAFVQAVDHFVVVGDPDFNWHLSGDRRVAPRQVFSDARRIWLQWHPHQAIPTVFAQIGCGNAGQAHFGISVGPAQGHHSLGPL